MQSKCYIHILSHADRKRYEHVKERNAIIGFVVQYETKIGDTWYPVVRYDTAHGAAHKDIFDINGLREKVFLGITDYKEALNLADIDVKENWLSYKKQFLAGVKNDRKRDI